MFQLLRIILKLFINILLPLFSKKYYNRANYYLYPIGITERSPIMSKKLAKLLGVSQPSIAYYLNGGKMPALDTLANLCKIIDVSPSYILCFED